jgi:hypothetical protein
MQVHLRVNLPGGEMITQGSELTMDYIKAWHSRVTGRLYQMRREFRDPARVCASGDKRGPNAGKQHDSIVIT